MDIKAATIDVSISDIIIVIAIFILYGLVGAMDCADEQIALERACDLLSASQHECLR